MNSILALALLLTVQQTDEQSIQSRSITNTAHVWEQIGNTYPETIASIHPLSDRDWWAVTWEGTILHTENEADSWSKMKVSIGKPVREDAIFFIDSKHGWAVGGYGTAFRTTDGGKEWEEMDLGTTRNLVFVHFFNNREGLVALGGSSVFPPGEWGPSSLLRTNSGGETWDWAEHPFTSKEGRPEMITAAEAIEDQVWLFFLDGVTLHSADRGKSWENEGKWFFWWTESAAFSNRNTGWMLQNNSKRMTAIMTTADGGKGWDIPSPSMEDYYDVIQCIDDRSAWIGGPEGKILHTSDGGKTWTTETCPFTERVITIRAIRPGWVIASCGGRVLRRQEPK